MTRPNLTEPTWLKVLGKKNHSGGNVDELYVRKMFVRNAQ